MPKDTVLIELGDYVGVAVANNAGMEYAVLFAHAVGAVTTTACRRAEPSIENAPTALIMLTVNEFRRLLVALLLQPLHAVADILAWSRWRRRHYDRARARHYYTRHQHH
jgi:hypothetical protein